jgi:hypothetical protein
MCSFKHDALESTLALSLNKMKKGDYVELGPNGAARLFSAPRVIPMCRSASAVPIAEKASLRDDRTGTGLRLARPFPSLCCTWRPALLAFRNDFREDCQ